ncbi:hypothetical protein [Sinorhizobium psoraleae]|uniref:Uncharacterized protein n=1 Tax=Sinorhizobium psoraleae TaxID=520838 RepID=A0ABT4KDM5_9HYPH|nr:hypothetical protein [Sinorhizobium psoraleae]MCZ4089953.1 hypothetical protein [Sinorhizobium psoraleae]
MARRLFLVSPVAIGHAHIGVSSLEFRKHLGDALLAVSLRLARAIQPR